MVDASGARGLVHVSSVDDKAISFDDMLDAHRLLVGPEDRLDNIGQLKRLLEAGYEGYVAFEPFAQDVHDLEAPVAAVVQSMEYIRQRLADETPKHISPCSNTGQKR